jgi:hypothetical protein
MSVVIVTIVVVAGVDDLAVAALAVMVATLLDAVAAVVQNGFVVPAVVVALSVPYFFPSCAGGRGWTRTLNLWIER